MDQRGFNDFLKSIGLVNYPFNLYTAENEQEYADRLFVRADNYDSIKGSYGKIQTNSKRHYRYTNDFNADGNEYADEYQRPGQVAAHDTFYS